MSAEERVEAIRAFLRAAVEFYSTTANAGGEWAEPHRIRADRGPEALVLRYGRPFQGTSWESWRGRGYRRRKQHGCFGNALDYSLNHDDLLYVEGYAAGPESPEPIHHAWCVTEDRRVVDPTWADANETTTHLGIPSPAELSAKLLLAEQEGRYGNHLNTLMAVGDEGWLRELEGE